VEQSGGEVAECCHGVWSVPDPGLAVVFAPGGVTNMVVLFSIPSVGVCGCAGRRDWGVRRVAGDEGELFADSYIVQAQNVSADAAELGGVRKSIPVASVVRLNTSLCRVG
jgi:hypothetical protein